MKPDKLKQVIAENLSGYQVNDVHYRAIMHRVNDRENEGKNARVQYTWIHPRKSVCVALLVLLMMSVTTLAATIIPNVSMWLQERADASRLGNASVFEVDVPTMHMGSITATVKEAVSDGRSFLCSIKFESDDELIIPYSGYDSDIADMHVENPNDLPITYVSLTASFGDFDQEIYTSEYDEHGALYIMSEGFADATIPSNMTITLKTLHGDKTEVHTLTVPIQQLSTVAKQELDAPLPLGETGYVLEKLSLHKTELKTYIDWNVQINSQPIAYAIKHPFVILVDKYGNELNGYWPYTNEVPLDLTIQVWAKDKAELLFEQHLSVEDFKEVQQ